MGWLLTTRFELVNCIENYLQLTLGEAVEFASLRVPESWRTRTVSSLVTWSDRILFEGERKGAQLILLDVLEGRFGPVSDEVRRRVERIRSLDRLRRLARKAGVAESIKSLRLG
jgi:hypothetical protein